MVCRASISLPKLAELGMGFQVVGTAGILDYAFDVISDGIWFGACGRTIAAGIFDGVVCGAVTGAIFGSRWPQ